MVSKVQHRGFKKATDKPPDKKMLESFGPKPVKPPSFNIPGDKNFGEKKLVGSKAEATGAMRGRAPPAMPKMRGKGPARADAKKQFKPSGKKVF